MDAAESQRREPARRTVVALAGNPNAGKSTVFTGLTGVRQKIANYPGVTVESREGTFEREGRSVAVVDLPGTYSLTALSPDELVARHFLVNERPDLVVDVVDVSQLERHLYLTVQLMEMGVPLLLAFNKGDLARARGQEIDTRRLSELLGAPIVETVASEGRGLDALRDGILAVSRGPRRPTAVVRYGREIEEALDALLPLAEACPAPGVPNARWLAVKMLEGDEDATQAIAGLGEPAATLKRAAAEWSIEIARHFGDRTEIVIADQRYGFISGACQESVRATVEVRHDVSDRIDDVVTRQVFGLPIFFLLMFLVFKLTFALGGPVSEWIEGLLGWLGLTVDAAWPPRFAAPLKSLALDGVIGGVGGVLVFLPNVVFLFAAISFLEDSGYMARGAFLMDRFMHKIGLHGRSFIPAMLGFGCTVPAILATRTLETWRDRMTTMLVLPLISCGARFPIYSLFVAAFFPEPWRARILMALYVLGIALAAGLARLLRSTVFRGEASLFVMELPPYRMPTPRAIGRHTWDRTRLFLRKAGTLIVGASVVLWALTNYPKPTPATLENLPPEQRRAAELSHSWAGRLGRTIEPAMRPVGFDWKASTALVGALAAKELFVAQMSILHALGDPSGRTLGEHLRREYTPLQAIAIMVFCLISLPCVATCAAVRAESGRWRWAVFQAIGLTVLAYVVTLAVYQTGLWLRIGTSLTGEA
jgi:ferrous iron transport protein B